MRRRVGLQAIALVVGLAAPSFGQAGGGMGGQVSPFRNFGAAGADSPKTSRVCSVKIMTADGKATTGSLRLTTVVIGCSFGVYEIKPAKVQEVRFGTEPGANTAMIMGQNGLQRSGQVVTTSGEVIDGVVLIPNWWRVETDLGILAPNSEGIKSIAFSMQEVAPRESLEAIPPPGGGTIRPQPDQLEAIPPTGSNRTRAVPPPT